MVVAAFNQERNQVGESMLLVFGLTRVNPIRIGLTQPGTESARRIGAIGIRVNPG